MKRFQSRHYSEEELLMHHLREETDAIGLKISSHLQECSECAAIFEEYAALVEQIQTWSVQEPSLQEQEERKTALMARFRREQAEGKRDGLLSAIHAGLAAAWNYALEHPLPTLAYVTVTAAFALERTITTFRLNRLLPGVTEVVEILKQVF